MKRSIENSIQKFKMMKSIIWIACLAGLGLVSCDKEKESLAPANISLLESIQQDPQLSLFYVALQRSGLDTVISDGGPYTVFAPADSALKNAGFTREKIEGYDRHSLKELIGYNIINGRISSDVLVGYIADTMTSLSGKYDPVVSQNYYGTFINGIKVTQGNKSLANGVLHVTEKLATPPTANLLETINKMPNLSMAAYIINKVWTLKIFAENPAFITGKMFGRESAYSSVTLLIPDNAAFQSYGYAAVDDLKGLDSLQLIQLMKADIMYRSYFTADFMGGKSIISAYGAPYYSTLASGYCAQYDYSMRSLSLSTFQIGRDGLTLYGNSVALAPRIKESNILAHNGVLHIIDRVFVPIGNYPIRGL
jgi:uncharacterized surface protein with fasciclin (FAS1) repeats